MRDLRTKGFTLVELLVVISIIALLLGLLMPALNKVRQIGKRTVCKAQLRSVAQALRMYLDDNKQIMPPAAGYGGHISAGLPWNPDNPMEKILDKLPIVYYLGPYISMPSSELANPPYNTGLYPANYKKAYAKVLCCPGDQGKHFFTTQQSSYNFMQRLGGRSMNKAAFTHLYPQREVDVLWDYKPFHGKEGKSGAVNYLFADCHVGDLKGD